MGVKGLWKLLDGTGRPLNLESLDGMILAVDISVWLNMAIKGMRDYHAHASTTAHLTTLFNRICKLLYYGVKPVFVFDGQAPTLKQKTLRERRERKRHYVKESKKVSEKILHNYLKKQILQEAVGKSSQDDKPSTSNTTLSKDKPPEKDIYDLPPLASQLNNSDQDELEEELKMRAELQNEYLDDAGHVDIASIMDMNIDSKDFESLPSDIQYELLKDLKEIRKRRRTRIEAMPEESNSFSDYQIAGLLAKRKITKKMEHVENKMSEENLAASTLQSGLNSDIMEDHIVDARQLVSDSTSHYIWLRKLNKKVKNNSEEAREISEIKTLHVIPEEETSSAEKEKSTTQTKEGEALINMEPPSDKEPLVPIVTEDRLDDKTEQISPPFKKDFSTGDCLSVESSGVDKSSIHFDQPQDEKGDNHVCNLSNVQESQLHQTSKLKPEDIIQITKTESETIEAKDTNLNLIFNPEENKELESMQEDADVIKLPDKEVEHDDESSDEDFVDVSETEHKNVVPQVNTSHISGHGVEVVEDAKSSTDKSEEEVESAEDNPWEGLSAENVETFTVLLDAESKELQKLMQAKERAARDLNYAAVMECQELLKLFGLPYLVSPQEAEAQCATLELLGLTQGTVTDDSDIWLFGGRYVIKNMFGSKSDPVAFNASDIEMQLGLSRDRLICIALCTGSDYTTGIHGVGPVTAMEVLKEFGGTGIDGLIKLKKWWDEVSFNPKVAAPAETKIKSQLRKVNLKKDFPSQVVYKAYIQPVVDETSKRFEWGFPDLDELRNFAVGGMGWTRQKVDEVLLPVMKKLGQQRSSQTRITQFLPVVSHVNKKKSKRVLRAAAALTGKNDPPEENSTKRKVRSTANPRKKVEVKKEVKLNLSESSSDDN